MNWTRKNNPQLPSTNRRSEEITDIIDRMPTSFGRKMAWLVTVLALLILLLGWVVKYPDTVTGAIKINSDHASVKLVSMSSGYIHLMIDENQTYISRGDYIAVIENPASTSDMKKVASLLEKFHPEKLTRDNAHNPFPETVSLGELNAQYYIFFTALKNQISYWQENTYEKQRKGIMDNIRWNERLQTSSKELLETVGRKLTLSQKWLDKYAAANKNDIITYEYEIDQAKNEYLSTIQEEQSLKKEIISLQKQTADNWNNLHLLDVEQMNEAQKLHLNLLTAYQELSDNIKSWEQRYVFKAPFDGKVDFLKFVSENQYVQAGEQVFGILPSENKIFGQLLLPSMGAGKVSKGNKVAIKLDNYPYREYGSIEGRVHSISILTQTQQSVENTVETYLITVELPNGLITNYGDTLDFQYELGGIADIIVKDRRLLERLFDNLSVREL